MTFTSKLHLSQLYVNLEFEISKAKKRNKITNDELQEILTELTINCKQIKAATKTSKVPLKEEITLNEIL
jgi:hypothetical protein